MAGVNQDNKLEEKIANLQGELNQLNKLFEFTSITNAVSDLESLAVQLGSFLMATFKLKNIAFFVEEEEYSTIPSVKKTKNLFVSPS